MKRLTILSFTIAFAVSAIIAAPVSFAAKKIKYNEFDTAAVYIEKDTSWFDYENPKDTYRISNAAQLAGLASLVNENQVDRWKPTRLENFKDTVFILTKDIKLDGDWTPIGLGGASYFAGTFDGDGHTISGLDIKSSSGYAGLFGYLVGTVKDLKVTGSIDSGDEDCGGVAGYLSSQGEIIGCTSDVRIKAKDKTGGIAGLNDGGTIEGCMNLGNVTGTYKVGGIVGENWGGFVTECGNTGTVKSSKRGVATYGTGGIAGRSVSAEAEISKSFNHGIIQSDTEATGGVVGYTNAAGATVTDCYNTGELRILNNGSNSKISQSYAGGITGIIGATGVVIRNCYNAGSIKNADFTGGVIGRYINEDDRDKHVHYIRNNYYLTSLFKSGIGVVDEEKGRSLSKAVSGVSTGSMNGLATSLSVAYENDTGIYDNSGYPVLKWQEPVGDDEKTYIDGISMAKQKKLDKYITDNIGNSQYGQIIINLFSPANYTNDAMILYNEAQDKKEKKEEK